MQNETAEAVDAVKRIAQQRREALDRQIDAGLPKFVRSIRRTEVVITIEPTQLPYKRVNGRELAEELARQYGLTLETPEIVKQLQRHNAPVEGTGSMIEIAMAQNVVEVQFVGGRFPTSGSDFISINSLSFGTEAIQATVSGLTDVAETLIAEAFEILWRSAGAIKAWPSKDVQGSIQLKSFATHTKVDLGFNPLILFNRDMQAYLNAVIDKMGPEMVALSAYDQFGPAANTKAVLTLDELHLAVNTFNLVTGRPQSAMIKFSVMAKDEQGRGIVDITTHLPFSRHVEFIGGLIETARTSNC